MHGRTELWTIFISKLLVSVAFAAALTTLACTAGVTPTGTPAVTPPPATSSGAAPATGNTTARLDVDGYQFVVRALNDPAFGPTASAAWATSAVSGVGVKCDWTRMGPGLPSGTALWGRPGEVGPTGAIFSPLDTGATASRTGGLPKGSVTQPDRAEAVCGMRDQNGDHGVRLVITLAQSGANVRATTLALRPWSAP